MTVRDFHALRSHLGLPPVDRTDRFPDAVEAEARDLAAREPSAPTDRTDLPFVTIDPPGSMDLDQAMHLERRGSGFRVHYAIADVGGAIEPGGAIDAEARRRGQTIYLPDGRVPLHPPVLSEGALSLLPDQVRAAALWTIDVAEDGSIEAATVARALVRSVVRLDYAEAERSFDVDEPHPSIAALPALGAARTRHRIGAGAIDLELPEQQVVADGDGWTIRLEPRTQVDVWNAEVSLLTGMAAARLMIDAKVGLVRTLPDPADEQVERFWSMAAELGFDRADSPGASLATVDPRRPEAIALMASATRLLRGAGYAAFDDSLPEHTTHSGVGGPYAHVTAPLRRLADRFTTEVCLAVSASEAVPDWARAALPEVADLMAASDRRASEADRTAIDLVETWLMSDRGDEVFDAIVMRVADDGEAEILLLDPPVVSDCTGDGLEPGARVGVRVATIDTATRRVAYVTA